MSGQLELIQTNFSQVKGALVWVLNLQSLSILLSNSAYTYINYATAAPFNGYKILYRFIPGTVKN